MRVLIFIDPNTYNITEFIATLLLILIQAIIL